MKGLVSNIVVAKKFGFISGENGQEYFFHMTDVLDGQWDKLLADLIARGGGKIKVQFEAIKTPKGPRAKDVQITDQSA